MRCLILVSIRIKIKFMANGISAVLNTLNEEKHIKRALESVSWADEIIVCDMNSEDKTVEIARKSGAKVIFHKRVNYVEPARNFAISKTSNEWILIVDPDEEIPDQLAKRLKMVANKMKQIDYVRIPRKNIIFGRWMKGAMWWPDFNVRFFKKGKVDWTDEIHRPPKAEGQGLDFPVEERLAIVHHNYQTLNQYIDRMNRYTTIEANSLVARGYKFNWRDLFKEPLSEFLSRFFAHQGYQDGLHGLALSFLQAFSNFLVYLKTWEELGFKEDSLELKDIENEKSKAAYQINYWIKQSQAQNSFKRFLSKIKV